MGTLYYDAIQAVYTDSTANQYLNLPQNQKNCLFKFLIVRMYKMMAGKTLYPMEKCLEQSAEALRLEGIEIRLDNNTHWW